MQVMDSTGCKLQTVETDAGKPSVRILSWNVNGLRAVCRKHPSASLKGLVGDLNAEIICFQETKLTRQELNEDIAFIPGYDSFFNFANPDVNTPPRRTFTRYPHTHIRELSFPPSPLLSSLSSILLLPGCFLLLFRAFCLP